MGEWKLLEKILSLIAVVISAIACILNIISLIRVESRGKYERECIVESRFLTIRTNNGIPISITFRFCLTNISTNPIVLKEIYFQHPSFNSGKKILVDQIAKTQFDFTKQTEFNSTYRNRKSTRVCGSEEVLPYLLMPATKYEGQATVGVCEDINISSHNFDKSVPYIYVYLKFEKLRKYAIPIEYKEIKRDVL